MGSAFSNSVRPATIDDVADLVRLIHAFAAFQHEAHLVRITEADLLRDVFCESPKFHALVAEHDTRLAGYAFYFDYYSTWEGRPGLFLEDLFVDPEFRGHGLGKALLAMIAKIARDRNLSGIRWNVEGWNQDAIAFYKSLGAQMLENRRNVLLRGDALHKLAEVAQ